MSEKPNMHEPDDTLKREGPRRPYEAPAIEESSDFDTLALACTHVGAPCAPDDADPDAQPSS
jgi:hypothetical protein